MTPRCATLGCDGQYVRTVRIAVPDAAPVTVDLCFYCRGAVLDQGGRYVIVPVAA